MASNEPLKREPLTPKEVPTHTGTARQGQPGSQHPAEWRGDLNPDRFAGQNHGPAASSPEKRLDSAYDLKDLHDRLRGFPDDMLKQIPVLSAGMRLQQGAVYLDLNDPQAREIRATGDMEAGPHNRYVPKAEVDHFTWNRLLNIRTPERLGEPGTAT